MKAINKTTAVILLLICAITYLSAQPVSFKDLNNELLNVQKQLVPDKRVAIFEVWFKDTLHQPVVISGETNLPDTKQLIARLFHEKKISFVDSVRLLPDAVVGEKQWALVTISVSNLRGKPENAAELVSQVLMGTPLKVLDRKNDWLRVQTPEYYIGWMEASGMQLLTQKEIDNWKNADRLIFNDVSGYLYSAPDKKSEIVSDLVLGNLFVVESKEKKFVKVKLPDGRSGYVRKKQCTSFKSWTNKQAEVASIISEAKKMMGSPYLWGGTSSKAVDCSGFVKTAFYSQGIILARDASQQAKYGDPVDFTNIENLKQGDLLFFGRSAQRITHVGIYLQNGDFIHSSGRVHIASIIPTDPKYVSTRNLVAARRIIGAVNSGGIVPVRNHEWYNLAAGR